MSTPHVRGAAAMIGLLAAIGSPATAQFDANGVSLLGNITLGEFPSLPTRGNDCWGYTSPSGREYALMGLRNALAVVEVTSPTSPSIIASIPHPNTIWCDVKTYLHYAYIVTDNGGVGIQVIDLSDVDNGNVTLVIESTEGGQTESHNIIIDTESCYLYLVGSDVGGGRLMAYSLADPEAPSFEGQISDPGNSYCHDAQVVTYTSGTYAGEQIAFCANGSTGLDIYNVTDKANMVRLSRSGYENQDYTHQCWVDEDRRYIYLNDELDTINRTTIFNITDLANPVFIGDSTSGEDATDHNLYVHEGIMYEAEYRAGLRIFCLQDPQNPVQVGWFDTFPDDNMAGFEGAWSCYPYFASGNVLISDRERGLFIVDVSEALVTCNGGIPGDLNGDGAVDTIDFLALLASWGACPDPCPPTCTADLNEDCAVDTIDMLALLANWG